MGVPCAHASRGHGLSNIPAQSHCHLLPIESTTTTTLHQIQASTAWDWSCISAGHSAARRGHEKISNNPPRRRVRETSPKQANTSNEPQYTIPYRSSIRHRSPPKKLATPSMTRHLRPNSSMSVVSRSLRRDHRPHRSAVPSSNGRRGGRDSGVLPCAG